jgi:hypothetical protein
MRWKIIRGLGSEEVLDLNYMLTNLLGCFVEKRPIKGKGGGR